MHRVHVNQQGTERFGAIRLKHPLIRVNLAYRELRRLQLGASSEKCVLQVHLFLKVSEKPTQVADSGSLGSVLCLAAPICTQSV